MCGLTGGWSRRRFGELRDALPQMSGGINGGDRCISRPALGSASRTSVRPGVVLREGEPPTMASSDVSAQQMTMMSVPSASRGKVAFSPADCR